MKLSVKREGGRISLRLDAGSDAGQSDDSLFAEIFVAGLDAFQSRMKTWSDARLPDREKVDAYVSLTEEVGELGRAVLKGRQGVRFTAQEIAQMKREEAADVLLALLDFCALEGFSLAEVTRGVFEKKSTPAYDLVRATEKRRRDAARDLEGALSMSLFAMRRGGLSWQDLTVQSALKALGAASGLALEEIVMTADAMLEAERKSSAAGKPGDAP